MQQSPRRFAMQSSSLNERPSSSAGSSQQPRPHFASTAPAAGRRPTADFVPSGFPGGGGYDAHAMTPLSASTSATGVAVGPGGSAAHASTNSGGVKSGGGANGAQGSSVMACTDSAAAAEWRALYGASAEMMAATAGAFRAGSAGVSFMTPIFHLTAHDSTIVSMEHNNHCKLLAIATSKNEILVTWTQLMPVIENMGALRAAGDDDLFGGEQAPPVDERLLEWDPATMSILIDELPYPCTELSWAPWQQGIYLAGLCPGHGLRVYRYSHGHWALDDCVHTTDSTSCAISKNFTVACACSRGRVELWVRGAAGAGSGPSAGAATAGTAAASATAGGGGGGGGAGGSAWVLSRTLTLPPADEELTGANTTRSGSATAVLSAPHPSRHRPRDVLGVSWDESGSLLAIGDAGGSVHVVAAAQDSTRLGELVYRLPPSSSPSPSSPSTDSAGPCRQVAWAPSSGRSFLSLAMVFANCVRLVLFRRPRFMSAAGLPHTTHGGRAAGGGGHSGAAGTAAGGGGGGVQSVPPLQPLAMTVVACEEVARLTWNGTGTRFVTSHLDSSVNIWAVDVHYQHLVRADADGASGGGAEGHGASLEKRLSLTVAVRRTSSVHPYHAVSK